MKIRIALLILITWSATCLSQNGDEKLLVKDPYSVKYAIEAPVTLLGAVIVPFSQKRLQDVARLSDEEVLALSPTDVNRFDRSVLDFPSSGYENARNISDYGLNATVALPALLLIDRNIRHNFLDFVTLYVEAHVISSFLYQVIAFTVRRPRPLAYNNELSVDDRSGGNVTNSFPSGHTTSTATASFFMAKVFCDFHDTTPLEKILIYTSAAVPPAVVGNYRIRAGKHFRTDVMIGFVLGAAAGILVPELHKKRNPNLSLVPTISDQYTGIGLRLRL